jgi:hypothetical protein
LAGHVHEQLCDRPLVPGRIDGDELDRLREQRGRSAAEVVFEIRVVIRA